MIFSGMMPACYQTSHVTSVKNLCQLHPDISGLYQGVWNMGDPFCQNAPDGLYPKDKTLTGY
jgi:hypothetical protein